jgi:leader peptidase (prepilin peptidase)/N-methyltransferase
MNFESVPTFSLAALGSLYLIAVAWPLSRVDIKEHRLPNRLVLPALPISLGGQLAASALSDQWLNFGISIVAGVTAFVIGLAANRWASLGMGDVKLITAISLSLGWFSFMAPLVAIMVAFLIASLVILALFMLGKTTLGQSIALGPYLLAGFAVTQILTWSTYLGGLSPNFLM